MDTGAFNMEKELAKRFTYHSPKPKQLDFYEEFRDKCHDLAQMIVDRVPQCREQSLALTKLEEVVMWANAGVARRS